MNKMINKKMKKIEQVEGAPIGLWKVSQHANDGAESRNSSRFKKEEDNSEELIAAINAEVNQGITDETKDEKSTSEFSDVVQTESLDIF